MLINIIFNSTGVSRINLLVLTNFCFYEVNFNGYNVNNWHLRTNINFFLTRGRPILLNHKNNSMK